MRLKAHNHHIKKIEIKSQQLHYNNRLGKGYFVKKTKELRINPDRRGKSTLIPMYKIQQSEKYIHTKINCTFFVTH